MFAMSAMDICQLWTMADRFVASHLQNDICSAWVMLTKERENDPTLCPFNTELIDHVYSSTSGDRSPLRMLICDLIVTRREP